MDLRPYDPGTDREALWSLKAAFERELGAGGGDEKADRYEGKLDADYRRNYLAWVERCVEREERCVAVAPAAAGGTAPADRLAGYVFVLPGDLAFVWDAAVLNEIYVREDHRGTGLGDDLMDAALDVARDQDLPLDRVVLDVDRENDRARAFYERHGFDHWGEMVARDL